MQWLVFRLLWQCLLSKDIAMDWHPTSVRATTQTYSARETATEHRTLDRAMHTRAATTESLRLPTRRLLGSRSRAVATKHRAVPTDAHDTRRTDVAQTLMNYVDGPCAVQGGWKNLSVLICCSLSCGTENCRLSRVDAKSNEDWLVK